MVTTACVPPYRCVHAFYYAMKANSTPDILRILASEGFGMECVSLAELRHARSTVPDAPLLFTPNFCGLHEYKAAFELGAEVTIDGDDILLQAPQVFAGKDIALRVDPGRGLGHSKKVVTAGASQKFGHPIEDVEAVAVAAKAAGATIVGIHELLNKPGITGAARRARRIFNTYCHN